MRVEILGSTGWRSAGDYRPRRARQLVQLIESTGAIVRAEGDPPIRSRIEWVQTPGGAWTGQVDAIVLFILAPDRVTTGLTPAVGSWWSSESLLPGYQNQVRKFRHMDDAKDGAERMLDHFIWRMGVRAAPHRPEHDLENTVVDLVAFPHGGLPPIQDQTAVLPVYDRTSAPNPPAPSTPSGWPNPADTNADTELLSAVPASVPPRDLWPTSPPVDDPTTATLMFDAVRDNTGHTP